jgi:RNA recognition motif-containing protein
MLNPDPERKSSAAESSETAKNGKTKKESATAEESIANKSIKAIPHIVFVGQLDFRATSNDIEEFLRTHGVEGSIKIRMRTSTSTGEFLGSAFVELENAKEMYKAIALHHKPLFGRALNIEKSCGGRNKDSRASRIDQKRAEQLRKVREPSDRVLGEFDSAGVISIGSLGDGFKEKLYAVSASTLNEVLSNTYSY